MQKPDTAIAAPPKTTEVKPAVLALLLFGSTMGVMAGAIIGPVLPLIRNDLDLGDTALGLVITTHGLVIALTSPAVGWAIDRWGVRTPLVAGLAIYAVGGAAGMFVESYPVLIASRMIFGVGAACLFTGTTTAMLSLYPGHRRDRVMGWRSSTTALGGVLWPLIGGALGALSWHAPFAIYLLGLPLGVGVLALMPDTRRMRHRNEGTLLALLRSKPSMLLFYGVQFAMGVLLYGLVIFLPLRLHGLGVTAPILFALFTATASAAASLVGFSYPQFRARLSDPALLSLSVTLWAAGFLVMGGFDEVLIVGVGAALFGAGMGLAFPAVAVLVGDSAPESLRGRATSLIGTTNFLGQFLSPIMLGPLVAAYGVGDGYVVVAGAVTLFALALLTWTHADGAKAFPTVSSGLDANPPSLAGTETYRDMR
ncbi:MULTISPECIES: MFS transporter [Rhodococcus]|uniref:Transporter, MFS superfamily n=1 Tax=Rhodococcus jostii (strain RHA1) TaxID=101510 RepID=Q0RWJ6_RHOJR|nr:MULTISPECIES: MFS transporter [Rhodococcus]ABH00340.1 transporter, MFS superfamily [Rhodococcus jostii RHA1]